VGAINNECAIWNLVQIIDEDRPLLPELIHDMAVVNDLLPNIHRLVIQIESDLDHINGAVHPGAEPSRRG